MNYEEQVHKGWTMALLIALAVALAVIFYLGYSSSANVSETTVKAPIALDGEELDNYKADQAELEDWEVTPCDTDLDCQLKNPEIFNEENEE